MMTSEALKKEKDQLNVKLDAAVKRQIELEAGKKEEADRLGTLEYNKVMGDGDENAIREAKENVKALGEEVETTGRVIQKIQAAIEEKAAAIEAATRQETIEAYTRQAAVVEKAERKAIASLELAQADCEDWVAEFKKHSTLGTQLGGEFSTKHKRHPYYASTALTRAFIETLGDIDFDSVRKVRQSVELKKVVG